MKFYGRTSHLEASAERSDKRVAAPEPGSRRHRIAKVLASGGYSLLERPVGRPHVDHGEEGLADVLTSGGYSLLDTSSPQHEAPSDQPTANIGGGSTAQ